MTDLGYGPAGRVVTTDPVWAAFAPVIRVLNDLYAKVEELNEPASTYGIYLAPAPRDGEAEVHTSGRRMRLKVSPLVDPAALVPGTLVRLGEGTIVVEACGFDPTGQLATMIERDDAIPPLADLMAELAIARGIAAGGMEKAA